MSAYLDTHVVIWLCEDKPERLSKPAVEAIQNHDLLISPAVLIELNFLLQIGRIIRNPLDLAKQLRRQLGVQICEHSFADMAETALFETWTRDPFDLLIVSHAKANKYAPLVTQDEKIRRHYPKAVW
ncbi:MAG TPA: type II toxin-antitoxin system VapC family toxin [Bryobacteraceae bacterium]|nr:type II toxin-antitoxin system VapC family toxin [Bryobacteraceae bacterium]